MPKMTGLADELVVLLNKHDHSAWMEIINVNPVTADLFLQVIESVIFNEGSVRTDLSKLVENLITSHPGFSKAARDILEKISQINTAKKYDGQELTEIQAAAIRLLLDPKFIKTKHCLLALLAKSESNLNERFSYFLTNLDYVARGNCISADETWALREIDLLAVVICAYLNSIKKNPLVKASMNDINDCYEYLRYLPGKLYQPSIFNRMSAVVMAGFYCFVFPILFANPINTILRSIARRNPKLLFYIILLCHLLMLIKVSNLVRIMVVRQRLPC